MIFPFQLKASSTLEDPLESGLVINSRKSRPLQQTSPHLLRNCIILIFRLYFLFLTADENQTLTEDDGPYRGAPWSNTSQNRQYALEFLDRRKVMQNLDLSCIYLKLEDANKLPTALSFSELTRENYDIVEK